MSGSSQEDARPIAHFVFGLREQDEPFHLVHYLAIASCLSVLEPREVMVHCDRLPYGIYWDLIRPHVTLRRVRPIESVEQFDYDDPVVAAYSYAHQADIVRLDALLEFGGVYADIDTLFVAPPPDDCWAADAAIGREADVFDERSGANRSSLCNAVIFGHPGSTYLRVWRERIATAMDGSWSAHSCLLADDIATEMPEKVHVTAQRTFHHFAPTPEGIADLLEHRLTDTTGISAVHLCAHLWWSDRRRDFSTVDATQIDEQWVRSGRSTYSVLARPFLPDHGLF